MNNYVDATAVSSVNRKMSQRLLKSWMLMAALGCQTAHVPRAAPHQAPATPPVTPARDEDAWRLAIPLDGTETPWSYPTPMVTTLANQVTVYVQRLPRGPVSLSLVVRRGASDTQAAKSGLCSLAAKLMAEATKTKDHYILSELAESLGSTLSGDANRDFIHLTLDTLSEDVATGINLLSETLTAPAFRTDDFERLRKQHLDDLASERQVPSRLASLVGLRAVLGADLGAPVGGRQASVQALTIADIRDWHRTYVQPTETALFVVGPVDPHAVISVAEHSLGKLKGAAPKPGRFAVEQTVSSTRVYVVDRPGSVQSAVLIAHAYPKRIEAGLPARQLLDNVIGGQFTSRINQNLREQHAYTYGAHSAAVAARHFGLLTISTSVEINVTVAAVQEIIRELRELRGPTALRPTSAEELERARAGVIHHLGAHLEDGHRLLADLEQLFVHALPANYWNDYLTEIRSLDAVALAKESERLTPERLSIVLVSDLSRIRDQLDAAHFDYALAPSEWLD